MHRSLGTSPVLPSGWAWHQVQSMPKRSALAWSNVTFPDLTGFAGVWWQSTHFAVPSPAFWPLKWQRMQVDVVTAMWLPWTICEWHDVQRSVLPRRISTRYAAWSNWTPPIVSLLIRRRRSWHRRHAASSISVHGFVP